MIMDVFCEEINRKDSVEQPRVGEQGSRSQQMETTRREVGVMWSRPLDQGERIRIIYNRNAGYTQRM